MAMMDNIMIMDETMVSYRTPRTKKQSKQWTKKGQKPIPALQSICCWQRAYLHPHCAQGHHNKHQLHREGPGQLHEVSQEDEACDGDAKVFFDWINASIHTAAVMKMWLAANNIQLFQPHSY